MKLFVLLHHWNDESYGNWDTTIKGVYQSKQSAEDYLRQLEASHSWDDQYNTPNDNRYSIQEHTLKG